MKSIKRSNPVTKKAPVTVELLSGIYVNFIDTKSVADFQLRVALMIGFSSVFCLRISEIGDLGGNDLVAQSTEEGDALTVRIRKSKQIKKDRAHYAHYYRRGIAFALPPRVLIGCGLVDGIPSLIYLYSIEFVLAWSGF